MRRSTVHSFVSNFYPAEIIPWLYYYYGPGIDGTIIYNARHPAPILKQSGYAAG